jgi:IMP dehydrogenase
MFKETIAFDDVLLTPRYSDIESRKEVDLTSHLGKIKLDIPIISSPMDTVTENHMAACISIMGGLGIVHRYNTVQEQCDIVTKAIVDGAKNIGAAIGVTGDYLERATELKKIGTNVLCVDVAHGHHISVKNALEQLRKVLGNDIHIMAGNVATQQAFKDLSSWGANSIRVGVGGGSICSTRIQTGHGVPTLTSVIDCQGTDYDSSLVADGGIKTSGDIVKALAAGADFVMLGSMLAGTYESPGEILQNGPTGKQFKLYRGMASKEAQINWKGSYSSFEGVSHRVDYKGTLNEVLSDIIRNIRSGLSYSGARTIRELQSKAAFIKQSTAGQIESSPHILKNG